MTDSTNDSARERVSVVTIRAEHPQDAPAIHAVHTASFPTPLEARLVDALRAAGQLRISLVATIGGDVVGHVAFSPVTIDGTECGLGLAPVAVLPEHRRQGIGAALIREGLAAAGRTGCGLVVLVGEPAYYSRFGFGPASRWGLKDEYGAGDAFQALELRKGAIPEKDGLVRYAPEFAQAC
ncbi:MAG TPA: N-acetyltransferase [Vicinamibacterales bacterium]|nr:N-acetyltransferase [Vicinamibacterales bacterium]